MVDGVESSGAHDTGRTVKVVCGYMLMATVGVLVLLAVQRGHQEPDFMDVVDARWMDQYVAVHESAASRIPVARQMEETFGEADHFITRYGSRGQMTWHTLCFVNDRYELQMSVKVTVDYHDKTVTQVGEPTFVMDYIVKSSESGATDFGGTEEYTLDQWELIYAADGDFGAIGLDLETTPAPEVQNYIDFYRSTLIPIDLVPADSQDPH